MTTSATTSTAEPTEQQEPVCRYCGGRRYVYLDVPPDDRRYGKAVPCVCQRAALRAEQAATLRRASNLQHLSAMSFDSFITDRYDSPQLTMALQEARSAAQAYAANPQGWLVLTGSYGSGKTHLAAAIANYRVDRGLPTLFVVVPDLLDTLRATFAPDSASDYDDTLEQVRNIELLVLDDLGTQHTTPWAAEKLYQILNHRYTAKLPTVITTNQLLSDMDPRLASRLGDTALVDVIPIMAPDFRASAGERQGGDDAFGSLDMYAGLSFDNLSERRDELDAAQSAILRKAIRLVEQFAENPFNWLVLRGPYGVGKTHLAAAAANKVRNQGGFVRFLVVADLLDHLRAGYQPGSVTSFDRRFSELRRSKLLVLDDLGTHSSTAWAQEKLFQLLNHRYVAHEATIITISAYDWDHLDDRLKTRLLDSSVATIIDLDIPGYRGATRTGTAPRRSTRRREP